VQQTLAENEIAKIFIRRQEYSVALQTSIEHFQVVDPRFRLSDI